MRPHESRGSAVSPALASCAAFAAASVFFCAVAALAPAHATAQAFAWDAAEPVYQAPAEMLGESVANPANPLLVPRLRLGANGVFQPTGAEVSGGGSSPDEPTFGAGPTVAFAWPLHENFALGVRAALGFYFHNKGRYQVDGRGDQRTWDFAPVLELRLPTSAVATFFVQAFAGGSVNQWFDDRSRHTDGGFGWHGGGGVGWDFMAGPHFGFFYQSALVYRDVTHDTQNGRRRVEAFEITTALGIVVGL